ncbi:MAG: cysteine hydrolase, partial [Treponema sp.]|nr:cysteine hydrolase [Treponema sp.]
GANCTVFATRDTHTENYLQTQEGQNLPVKHCIKGTEGWQINSIIAEELEKANARIIDKPTFGSIELQQRISELSSIEQTKIELVGLCTDICVVSNALLLKAKMPEILISVDPSCCAGVTPEKHQAALETMRSCQISIL